MKFKRVHLFSIVALAIATTANSQGTFQDLNFEEANIVPIIGSPSYPYGVTVANALPGWTVDYGNVQQSQILYNDAALGTTQVTLYANGYPGLHGPILDGNFSLLLQGIEINGVATAASISQTGQIPSGTHSLLFDSTTPGPLEPEVFIGSQAIALFPVGGGANYTIYGGNVSAWAGQTEQLTITAPGLAGNYLIDDISFSPTTVTPEPGPLALIGIAGMLFAAYRHLAVKRQ